MTNKTGNIVGIASALIYTIFHNRGNFNYFLDYLPQRLGSFVGALLIPLIISSIIYLFTQKNFGKVFGITSLIVYILSSLGNL